MGHGSFGYSDDVNIMSDNIKAKMSLCLTKHSAMKMYEGVDV
jgi:hypothetical protein